MVCGTAELGGKKGGSTMQTQVIKRKMKALVPTLLVPTLNEAALVPTLNEAALVPTLNEALLVPTLNEAALVPTLNEAALVPTLTEALLVPTLNEAALVPTLNLNEAALKTATKKGVANGSIISHGIGHGSFSPLTLS